MASSLLQHFYFFSGPNTSDQSSSADPALVPTVRRPAGDEAQVHVEHLPVDRIRRGAGPDQGEDALFGNTPGEVCTTLFYVSL